MTTPSKKILQKQAWVVSARSDVQWLLLLVRECVAATSDPTVEPDQFTTALIRNACDCGFSLWRAVFLLPEEKNTKKLLSHIDLFLKNVIDDNTILYVQDKSANFYSSFYYLRNAALRIDSCHNYLRHPDTAAIATALPKPQLDKFFKSRNDLSLVLKAFEAETSETAYTDTFEATLLASIALTELIEKHLKFKPISAARSGRLGR
jgi:hypothetical protein